MKTLLGILGDIKVFKYPMFIVYDPGSYDLLGRDIRDILDSIKDGDILLRGFNNYLDGYLISGSFSHAAFYYGGNKVIHAMAEGVFEEDILTFTRCDHLCILRFNDISQEDIEKAKTNAKNLIGCDYDFSFTEGNGDYYCSELVCKAYEHKPELNIKPETVEYLYGLIKKKAILPDAFLSSEALHPVYLSPKAIPKVESVMKRKESK
jgi:hypothetical protein